MSYSLEAGGLATMLLINNRVLTELEKTMLGVFGARTRSFLYG